MKSFYIVLCISLFLAPLSLTGCSSQLSEEETPVMMTDEDEPEGDVEFGPDNP